MYVPSRSKSFEDASLEAAKWQRLIHQEVIGWGRDTGEVGIRLTLSRDVIEKSK
jgi:hypothetical protein